jgi:hypothetical protein
VGVEGGSGLLDGVCGVPCNRDHRGVGGHVGYLGLGVLEGGEGDVPGNLLLSIISPNSFMAVFLGSAWLFLKMFSIGLIVDVNLLSLSLGLHVEHLVSLGHNGFGVGEGGVSSILIPQQAPLTLP